MALSPNTRLGRYEIRSQLGAGGMGEVYLAQDTKLNRRVAIKLLPAASASDHRANRRFLREAQAAATLDHPHICAIHEIGEDLGRSYIVMQYVEGETLAEKLKRGGFPLREGLKFAVQIADALAEAHAHGIVHRDIKPANIILTARGQAKVLDFGLAKIVAEQQAVESEAETAMASTPGAIIGTVPYMSPEQVRGEPIDARTDIFSFGVVLYEMLSGHRPFLHPSIAETAAAILSYEPQPLTRYVTDVPDELQRIVRKCLEKDREDRYQTAKDLLLDLRRLQTRLEVEAEIERSIAPETNAGTTRATGSKADAETVVIPAVRGAATDAGLAPARKETLVTSIARHKRLATVALLLVVASAIVFAYFRWRAGGKETISSLAVLPFVNDSRDPETEYLSDGITENLINNLSLLPNLTVKARSSVFRYKGKEADPQTVARELDVEAVLTGHVMQRGDELDIRLELVDARTNNHLWGEQYKRKWSDLVAMQSEIARDVSEKLRARLSGAAQERVTRQYTGNTAAYQLYLKGNYYANKRTEEGYQKAIDFFRQATDVDPSYALAYVGLADAYTALIGHSVRPAEEIFPLARAAAVKALQLDETLAEAYSELADIKLRYDWDWAGAEQGFNQAVKLNPNYAPAHYSYAYYLISIGRTEEAIAEMKKAQELDPLSLSINADYGEIYYFARRPDQAIEQLKKALELDATFVRAHFLLGRAYAQKGQCVEAVAESQKAKELDPESVEMLGALGLSYAWCGPQDEARKTLDELLTLSNRRYVSPHLIAVIYAALGDKDKGFEWLDKAVEKRFTALIYLKVNPIWDPLRSDPRFAERLRRVGLAP